MELRRLELRHKGALRRLELPLLALWAALALGLSALTTRIEDWFVMTDELLYERLAISVASVGSILPHVHGELIPNVNGLYPLLLAPAFADGFVPDSLGDAHTINAWVMSSACVPAFVARECREVISTHARRFGVRSRTFVV